MKTTGAAYSMTSQQENERITTSKNKSNTTNNKIKQGQPYVLL